MDTKDIIKSKVSEYRVSQSATADKVKEVQTLLSSNKKQQKAYDDIAPEVAMKKVMDFLMGEGKPVTHTKPNGISMQVASSI